MSFETAAEHATARPGGRPFQRVGDVRKSLVGHRYEGASHIVVCEADAFLGIVTIEELLSASADVPVVAYRNAGCDVDSMRKMLGAYSVIDPTNRESRDVSDPEIFDLLEFSYEKISFPIEGDWHSFMRHSHYSYDQEKGRAEFQTDVNRILERNGIAFELVDGEVKRLGSAGFHEALGTATFKTGYGPLDEMLEDARGKFLNRDLKVRRVSLERLWDAC